MKSMEKSLPAKAPRNMGAEEFDLVILGGGTGSMVCSGLLVTNRSRKVGEIARPQLEPATLCLEDGNDRFQWFTADCYKCLLAAALAAFRVVGDYY
jgi:hypothetical protein